MANKIAMIFGIDGQDGSFLAELLYDKGYQVVGMGRKDDCTNWDVVRKNIITINPDEIYNFCGISDVFSPYDNLEKLANINAILPQVIIETILKNKMGIKFFQASSSLIFGKSKTDFQNEETPFNPMYPYGAGKLYIQNIIKLFREDFGLFLCSAIYFSHVSERSKDVFFAKKICKAATTKTKITVGDLSSSRDFGYAPDYVEAAYLIMQSKESKDYVVGTGVLTPLRSFIKKVFECVNLDYRDYVDETAYLKRSYDATLCADIRKIKTELGWQPKHNIDEIIKIMVGK